MPADGITMPNYGGVTLIINAGIGGALASLPQVGGRNPIMGNNQSWAGHRTTKALVNLFPDETGVADGRAIWYTSGQNKEINDINQFTDGYMVTKFRNVDRFGNPGQDGTFTDTDYPLFRYADALLMYAEAVVRGGTGGTAAQAVTYMNQIRQRALSQPKEAVRKPALIAWLHEAAARARDAREGRLFVDAKERRRCNGSSLSACVSRTS